jgi:nitrite reductase/ring-hydroxylating ferredoxin subunit
MLIPVAAVTDLAPGMRRVVSAGNRKVIVVVERDGIFALLDECPHYQVPLSDGRFGNGTIECSWHKWLIDVRTGRCMHGLAQTPTFPVVDVDGVVHIDVPDAMVLPPRGVGPFV